MSDFSFLFRLLVTIMVCAGPWVGCQEAHKPMRNSLKFSQHCASLNFDSFFALSIFIHGWDHFKISFFKLLLFLLLNWFQPFHIRDHWPQITSDIILKLSRKIIHLSKMKFQNFSALFILLCKYMCFGILWKITCSDRAHWLKVL